MKSLKLLLFTLICSIASPALPAFAIVESQHITMSKVSNKKKVFPWEIFLGFRYKSISKTEAIVMGLICLVLTTVCAWYVFPWAMDLSILLKQIFVALCGFVLALSAIRYAVILIVNNQY